MSNSEPGGVEKVREALVGLGYGYSPVVLPKSARTSVEAAEALGCDVAQIAKSLVFRGRDSGRGVLVVASGVNRVDEKRLDRTIGEKVAKAGRRLREGGYRVHYRRGAACRTRQPTGDTYRRRPAPIRSGLGCRGQSEGCVLARPERLGVNDRGSGDPSKVRTRASGPCHMQQGGNE